MKTLGSLTHAHTFNPILLWFPSVSLLPLNAWTQELHSEFARHSSLDLKAVMSLKWVVELAVKAVEHNSGSNKIKEYKNSIINVQISKPLVKEIDVSQYK